MYSRFIGDRSIEKRDFGRIQKDRLEELKKWSEEVNRLRDKAKFYHCVFTIIITIIDAVEYSRPSVLDQSLDLLLLFFLH